MSAAEEIRGDVAYWGLTPLEHVRYAQRLIVETRPWVEADEDSTR